jgi:hypothetical protein
MECVQTSFEGALYCQCEIILWRHFSNLCCNCINRFLGAEAVVALCQCLSSKHFHCFAVIAIKSMGKECVNLCSWHILESTHVLCSPLLGQRGVHSCCHECFRMCCTAFSSIAEGPNEAALRVFSESSISKASYNTLDLLCVCHTLRSGSSSS